MKEYTAVNAGISVTRGVISISLRCMGWVREGKEPHAVGELLPEEPWGWRSPETWKVLPQEEGQSLASVTQQQG